VHARVVQTKGRAKVDLKYSREEWLSAVEAAELYEWDEIDAGEKHGPLAEWLCRDVYTHEKVDHDVDVITAAINALRVQGEEDFSPERLVTVLWSHIGEVWVDDKVEPREGEVQVEPEGTASLAAHRFDTAKW
jgi:hypothetical protein